MKRLDIEEVRKNGLSKGYMLLDNVYKNSSARLNWIDNEGYKYYATYEKVKTGKLRKYHPSNPYTIDNINNCIKNLGLEYKIISGEYKNQNSMFDWVDSDGYKYHSNFYNVIRKMRPISSHNIYSIENIKLYLKKFRCDYELLSEKYVDRYSKLEFKCKNNHVFYMSWGDFLNGEGCPKCRFRYRNHQEFVEYIKELYGDDYTVIGEYVNSQTKIMMRHNICGTIFQATPGSLGAGHGCPRNECCKKHGNEHYKWNDSLTDEQREKNKSRLTIPGYKKWRIGVFAKYNTKCCVCGCKRTSNNKLIPHHLNSWDINKNDRFNVKNGVCVCEYHHKDFHNKYGYGKNTKEQFEEYLLNQDNTEVSYWIAQGQ